MLERLPKKALSVLMASSILLSMGTAAVSATNIEMPSESSKNSGANIEMSAAIKANPFVSGAISMGVNKLYSGGLLFCGTALVKLANATDCDEFQAVASIINKWVCGGGQGQTLAAIKELCTQILNEIKIVNQNLTDYSAVIETMLSEEAYNSAMRTVNDKWQTDVQNFENANNVGNALKSYMEYMDIARQYTEGEVSIDKVNTARDDVFNEFCLIYSAKNGGFSSSADKEKKREIIFSDSTIDDILYRTIENMSNVLLSDTNYADIVAQFAYTALPFSSDQYNYIISSIDKQFTEIIQLEMLYQEFIAQRGEYLEEVCPDDEVQWNAYKSWNDNLIRINEKAAENMGKMIERDLKVSPVNNIYLRIDEYVKPEDSVTVTLKNNEYIKKFNSYEKEQSVLKAYGYSTPEQFKECNPSYSNYENMVSYSSVIKESVKYNRTAVLTQNGPEVFYIFDGTQFGTADDTIPKNLHFYKLDYKYNISALPDIHMPSCDFFNLTRGIYSDGANEYSCTPNAEALRDLFNTNIFSMTGSQPNIYLQNYLSVSGDSENPYVPNKMYIILPDYTLHLSSVSTDYEYFYVIDTAAQHPGTVLKTSQLSAEDIQTNKKGVETAYSVILTNNNSEYKSTLDVKTDDESYAEIFISSSDSDKKLTTQTAKAGSEITIKFKAANERVILDNLVIQRHNDISNPTNISNENVVLTREAIRNLTVDNDGYYTFNYTMPYSNATIVLNTADGYYVQIEDYPSSKGAVTLDSDVNVFTEGDMIDVIANKNVKKVYLRYIFKNIYDDMTYIDPVYREIKLTEDVFHNIYGSFEMPACDVIISYDISDNGEHIYNENGFCIECDAYEPAVYNKSTECYEISNAGQLYWFASLVNGDSSYADIDKQNTSADAVLVKDITVNDDDLTNYDGISLNNWRLWIPIGIKSDYSGHFDGQGHTISGLYINNNYKEYNKLNYIGLFGMVRTGSIKNLGLINSYFSAYPHTNYDTCFYVGGIAGAVNNATISNCFNETTIKGNYIGGIAYINTGEIINCYNAGLLYAATDYSSYSQFTLGGIVAVQGGSVKNCYNIGNIIASDNNHIPTYSVNIGSVIADVLSGAVSENCYYLENCCSYTSNDHQKVILYQNSNIGEKTAAQFASGEVAYLLNNSITDGTQAWYQNIDNGQTPDKTPKFKGGTVYYGHTCNNTTDIYTNSNIGFDGHEFNENGFCIRCGVYEPAVYNESTDYYEINNAGQLFWFGSLVNGDNTYANFTKQNQSAKGLLTTDIDLENRQWQPIKNFKGSFDGQNHTISNLNISQSKAISTVGLFGSSSGIITNFTVKGSIQLGGYGEHIGGVVGYANGGKISDVSSYVNIYNTNNAELLHIGGICGTLINSTIVEKCIYYAAINMTNSEDCIGGIVGYTNSGTINNCANLGSINTEKKNALTGGILGYVNNTAAKVQNCYNYGSVSNGGVDGDVSTCCGAIIGLVKNCTIDNIKNNYYLNTSSSLAFGSNSKSGLKANSKTDAQFVSGEVAYLLNQGITDGSQVWYQNIDNGKKPDSYPVLNNTHGTVYELSYNNTYSNYYSQPTAFDIDDDNNFIIKTYDDLVLLSELMRSEYETYGTLNYVLKNNIIAPSDSEWTQGIGSVDENKPFNGTFDGNGYVILGLNINAPKYGGLFEYIGENGKVEEVQLIDCDYVSVSEMAGAIAVINDGIIDHCLSGLNLSSGVVFVDINGDGQKEQVNVLQFNSEIKGTVSGGVVAVNNGNILGTRNAALITENQIGGGIAGENTGLIYGCANTGTIGNTHSVISGGLVGENSGTIQASYNLGKVSGRSSDFVGSVSGSNKSNASVKNTFYTTINGLNPVGTKSEQALDNTNTKKLLSNMRTDSFVDELNSVSNEYQISWIRNDKRNNSYPTIVCAFYQLTTQKTANGISVTGYMHNSLNINYKTCTMIDAFETYNNKSKVLSAYELDWLDNNGNQLPMELWLQGVYTLSIPLSDSRAELLLLDNDGNITKCEYTYENGNAVFTVNEPVSFAFVSTENSSTDNSNNSENLNVSTISTGDSSYILFVYLFVMIVSFVVFIMVQRKNFGGKNE